jgi:hypothetical protein
MLSFGYAKEESNNFIFNEAGSALGSSKAPALFTAELGRNLADEENRKTLFSLYRNGSTGVSEIQRVLRIVERINGGRWK